MDYKMELARYKPTYDVLMNRISMECYLHRGCAFTISGANLNLYSGALKWSECYRLKKSLFSGPEWIYEKTVDSISATSAGDQSNDIEKTKALLAKLPDGITYEKVGVTINQRGRPDPHAKLPDPNKSAKNAEEYIRHTGDYQITVSEAYASKIVNGHRDSKVIILGNFNKDTIEKARDFKRTVLSSHSEIIEPLFDGFAHCNLSGTSGNPKYTRDEYRCVCLSNTGFHGVGSNYRYHFEEISMKPLNHAYQCLGLASVIAEYGATSLQDEMYFIERWDDGIFIRRRRCYPSPTGSEKKALKDW